MVRDRETVVRKSGKKQNRQDLQERKEVQTRSGADAEPLFLLSIL